MKKIIADPAGDIRLTGQAYDDGIAFKASIFLFKEFGMAFTGTRACTQGNDITCSPWDEDGPQSPVHAKIKKLSEIATIVTGVPAILLVLFYFVLGIADGNVHLIYVDIAYIFLSAMELSKGISIFITRIFGNKQIRSFSKFLAAKNAVKNAYYDMGKIPSVDEAKMYSPFPIMASM